MKRLLAIALLLTACHRTPAPNSVPQPPLRVLENGSLLVVQPNASACPQIDAYRQPMDTEAAQAIVAPECPSVAERATPGAFLRRVARRGAAVKALSEGKATIVTVEVQMLAPAPAPPVKTVQHAPANALALAIGMLIFLAALFIAIIAFG